MTYENQKRPLKCDLEQRLNEATALLGSWRTGGRPVEATDAFLALALAPAQPAAQAWHVRGKSVEIGPAAPEPHYAEQFGINPAPGFVQDFGLETALYVPPAAPEPSSAYSRGYKEGSDATARELIGNHERDNKLAEAMQKLAELVDCYQRAEAAEAQLAAVRKAVDMARREHPHWPGWEPILSALTPAPSPGAGPGEGTEP